MVIMNMLKPAAVAGYLNYGVWDVLFGSCIHVFYNINLMLKIDPTFHIVEFMGGAKHAYSSVMRSFLTKKLDRLEPMVNEWCLTAMQDTLKSYADQNYTLKVTDENFSGVFDIKAAELGEIRWDIDEEEQMYRTSLAGVVIDVLFTVEEKYALHGPNGPLSNNVRITENIVSFEAFQDPDDVKGYNWRVVNIGLSSN